jgi:selenoprotein W-related protein
MPTTPLIEITYCRLCGWGLRARWMAQELLTTFAEEVGSVVLTPDTSGGVFEVRVGNETVWSRKDMGRLPARFVIAIFGAPGFRKSLAQSTSIAIGTASRFKSKPGLIDDNNELIPPP